MARCQFQLRLASGKNEKRARKFFGPFSFWKGLFYCPIISQDGAWTEMAGYRCCGYRGFEEKSYGKERRFYAGVEVPRVRPGVSAHRYTRLRIRFWAAGSRF